VSFIGLMKEELSSILTISRKSLVFRINLNEGTRVTRSRWEGRVLSKSTREIRRLGCDLIILEAVRSIVSC
jgi:hypothetical protein